MRLFGELIKISFQRQMAYRAANLAGLATNLFFGLLRAAVLVALYGARTEVEGMSVTDAITYTGLTQARIAYLSRFGWYDLMQSVYSGAVAADLLKPLNYFRFWLARDMGRAAASLLMRGLTIMLVYALIFDITVPRGSVQWMALFWSMLLGLLVSFGWRFLINLASFWTPDARGVGRFAFGLMGVISGFFLPLRFFPEWFQTVCALTPFPSMVNTPIEVYLGLLDGGALLRMLLVQALWAVALAAAGQVILRLGVRKLVIQGG